MLPNKSHLSEWLLYWDPVLGHSRMKVELQGGRRKAEFFNYELRITGPFDFGFRNLTIIL